MVEYNYIYKVLSDYGIAVKNIQPKDKKWQNITQDFAKNLYEVLYNEEQYMLGQIRTSSSSTYEIKWGNNNDFV